MQSKTSSATTAFRAIVMLAFVVAIPLIALNGSSLPEKVKNLVEKYWPVIAKAMGKSESTEAQPNLMPLQAPGSEAERFRPLASSVVPADYQSTVETRIPSVPGISTQNDQGYNVNSRAEANPFIAIQDRLRQLGATYYLLETWGNQRQFYRFYCQMAVGGNADYTHYFEAINSNPMEAMGDVLRQVEAWRGGGSNIR
jgi:hypothetical protein